MATKAVGTHPAGMHSCFSNVQIEPMILKKGNYKDRTLWGGGGGGAARGGLDSSQLSSIFL